MGLPDDVTEYQAPWGPPSTANGPFLAYEKDPTDGADYPDVSVITKNDANITHESVSGYDPKSQSPLWAENAAFSDDHTWPFSYNGLPPSGAISLPRSGNAADCDEIFNPPLNSDRLRIEDIFYIDDVTCAETAINNVESLGGYDVQGPGVVVVYITGSGTLDITNPFIDASGGSGNRILFVTGDNVEVVVDRNLSLPGDPDFSSTPLIEAAFVVNNRFRFAGVVDTGAYPSDDPDDSTMIEGPLIAKNIDFHRNRGSPDGLGNGGNGYPSEIVKYNSFYLYELTKLERERGSIDSNLTGLFVVDVDWIGEE
jgi:hypothetical protein